MHHEVHESFALKSDILRDDLQKLIFYCRFQDNIKHSLKNQGKATDKQKLQKRKLRKERSKIEGVIGNLKKDYSLEKIVLRTKEGAQIQTSLAMGTFNMFRVLREI